MWDPQRDFAYLKVPTSGVKSVVALSGCAELSCPTTLGNADRCASSLSSSPQVMVVTSEGVFYSYAIDLENGGECVLQKSYSLLDGIGDDSNGCVISTAYDSAHRASAVLLVVAMYTDRRARPGRSPMGD